MALRVGSSSTSQAAPVMLKCNDMHKSNFFVYVMLGADYQKQSDLRFFFPGLQFAYIITENNNNIGIDIRAEKQKNPNTFLSWSKSTKAEESSTLLKQMYGLYKKEA